MPSLMLAIEGDPEHSNEDRRDGDQKAKITKDCSSERDNLSA